MPSIAAAVGTSTTSGSGESSSRPAVVSIVPPRCELYLGTSATSSRLSTRWRDRRQAVTGWGRLTSVRRAIEERVAGGEGLVQGRPPRRGAATERYQSGRLGQ